MGLALSRNYGPAIVATTSLVAYAKVPRVRIYARAAYRLYFITGLINMAAIYFERTDSWKRQLEMAFTWSYALGLPLLAADVCCSNGVFAGVATLHILIPTATLIIYHYDPIRLDPYLLGVSHSYSMLAMAACGVLNNHLTPYAITLIYYFTLFRIDPKTAVMPTFMETWCVLISIANLFSIIEFR